MESVPVIQSKAIAQSDTCDSEAATVTSYPTVTVTVTATADNGQAATSSSPVQSSQTSSIKVVDQDIETPVPEVPKTSATPTSEVATTESKVPASIIAVPQVSQSSTSTKVQVPEVNTESFKAPTTLVPTPKPTKAVASIQTRTVVPVKATSAASIVPSPDASSSSGKRGILASGSDTALLVAAFNHSSKITWLVDWYSAPPPNLDSHIEFVPQNYGKQSDIAPKFEWTANAKNAIKKGDKYFLSFGEPETPNDKLHMEPQEAVDLFMKEMQPYAGSVTLGAPSVTQPDRDLAWLSEFLDLCDAAGCSIGFVCVHWIWSASEAHIQDFKNVVTKAIGIAKGKPVWVDNFAASGTNAEQQNFLNGVLPWLDANDAVGRYAYVSPSRSTGTGFLNADGSISSLGEFYATF